MANEVSPELLSNLETYLKQRERGEISLLSFYYKEVFNKQLRTDCGGCIEDAVRFLKTILINKTTKQMENFKWIGGENESVILKHPSGKTIVSKFNCNDSQAALIESIPKYSHLVKRINEPIVEKKSIPAAKESLPKLEVTILTSNEAKKDEGVVKVKRGRPKLK